MKQFWKDKVANPVKDKSRRAKDWCKEAFGKSD